MILLRLERLAILSVLMSSIAVVASFYRPPATDPTYEGSSYWRPLTEDERALVPSGEAAATKSSREAEAIVRELAPIEFAPLPRQPERMPRDCVEVEQTKFGPVCARRAYLTVSSNIGGPLDF